MSDQKQTVAAQLRVLRAVAVGCELRDQRAEAGAAISQRAAGRLARPVREDRPFLRGTREGVEQSAWNPVHHRLAAEAAARAAAAMPRRYRTDHAKAASPQRLRFVDNPAPVIELDADAVAEDDARRIGIAARLQH